MRHVARAAIPLIAGACAFAGHAVTRPTARTTSGIVAGTVEGGVNAFKGVAYGASTAGAGRWKAPAPPARWSGVRQATAVAPDCPAALPPGAPPGAPDAGRPARQSEDCLFLNVWAPRNASRLPVMVWIVGSGFQRALPNRPVFDGAALARKGVVVVTFGFRTGMLGYLALPGLAVGSGHAASGNYGILDAVAALRWTRANIAAFGGDPAKVTIFGQSAGAETVNILVASPEAKGLFQRAIQESGASYGQRQARPLAAAAAEDRAFVAQAFGTEDPAALRALPLDRLIGTRGPAMEPVIDGWLLPASSYEIFANGRQNKVPMIVGSNADEAQLDSRLDLARLRAKYAGQYGERAAALLARFPAPDDAAARIADKRIGTLMLGDFNAATTVRLAAAAGTPVFRYRFDHAPPPAADARARGAYHGAEYTYAFANLDKDPRAWTPVDRTLEAMMSGYWVNFARNGDPNGPGLPRWTPVTAGANELLRIGDDARMGPPSDGDDVRFLQDFFYGAGGLYPQRSIDR